MLGENTSPLPLERPIELWLRTGDAQAVKKALVDNGLLDGFADYLITVFVNNAWFADTAAAAHDLVELAQEFKDNSEQQQAVMALLPRFKWLEYRYDERNGDQA